MSNESKQTKPDCHLIGEDGNIFHIVGIAAKTLKRNSMSAKASEMTEKVLSSGSYEEALGIIGEYVNITSIDEPDEDFEECENLQKPNEEILESSPEQRQSEAPEMSM